MLKVGFYTEYIGKSKNIMALFLQILMEMNWERW